MQEKRGFAPGLTDVCMFPLDQLDKYYAIFLMITDYVVVGGKIFAMT